MVWIRRGLVAGAIVAVVAFSIRLCCYERSSTLSIGNEAAPASQRPERLVIDVTGKEYRWHIRYPAGGGVLSTRDDIHDERNLHVPIDTRVRLVLRSEDYLYMFELPELGVRDIAVPDFEFEVEFVARRLGAQDLLGSQMCGYDHPELLGKLVVESWEGYTASLQRIQRKTRE